MSYHNTIICYISADKKDEYEFFWKKYHVTIELRPPIQNYDSEAIITMLTTEYQKIKPLAVMTECADITDVDLCHRLWMVSRHGDIYLTSKKLSITWDKSRPQCGLGWDNHVILSNGYTCFELQQQGRKNIGRQELFSKMAQILCHDDYKKWNFIHAEWEDTVMQDNILPHLLEENVFLSKEEIRRHWLYPLFQRALQRAEFIRTGNTRPLRNYWLPGLNAGLPSVPKKDLFHETTFLVHDMCHFIFPDVLYNGNPSTLRHYHIARMASEAITMTFADMWFVDVIHDVYEYDYTKRGIYPIFEEIKRHCPEITPYELAWANTQYAVLGDTSAYAQYLDLEGPSWKKFDAKYSRFFMEDHHWTNHNCESMRVNSHAYAEFFKETETYVHNLGLTASSDIDDVKTIFDDMWQRYICNTSAIEKKTDKDHYWLGQSFIFFNYPSEGYKEAFFKAWDEQDEISMKAHYDAFIDNLKYRLYINDDEAYHYRCIYPFFKPHYVFYEQKSTQTLLEVAKKYVL